MSRLAGVVLLSICCACRSGASQPSSPPARSPAPGESLHWPVVGDGARQHHSAFAARVLEVLGERELEALMRTLPEAGRLPELSHYEWVLLAPSPPFASDVPFTWLLLDHGGRRLWILHGGGVGNVWRFHGPAEVEDTAEGLRLRMEAHG